MALNVANSANAPDARATASDGDPRAVTRAIDVFVQGAVLARSIYAVVGKDGIAAVPSPSDPQRPTYLFWSHQAEAARWADALVADPQVMAIDIPGFMASTIPAMTGQGALAGLDWTSEPVEAELPAAALASQLHEELVRDFATVACHNRMVWMLHDDHGVATVDSPDCGRVVPLWADRHLAEAVIATVATPGLVAMRKPLLELTNRYLLSSEGLKAQLAPGYVHAAGTIVMSPWALKALLNGVGRSPPRMAAIA